MKGKPFHVALLKALLCGMGLLLIATEGVLVLVTYGLTHPPQRRTDRTPADYGLANYETVQFPSSADGLVLDGWLLPVAGSRRTVIFCHGQGDNKQDSVGPGGKGVDAIELSRVFARLGYNALLFDFRGQGDLPPAVATLGDKEQGDLLGAIRFLQVRGLGQEVGVVGFSMGAGVALASLNKTDAIAFVVADSAPSDLGDFLGDELAKTRLLAATPFQFATLFNLRLLWGIDPSRVSPKASLTHSNVPVLLIYGDRDAHIAAHEVADLQSRLASPRSRLARFPSAEHLQAFALDPIQYDRAIEDFIGGLHAN